MHRRDPGPPDGGFTLLELVAALSVSVVSSMLIAIACVHVQSVLALQGTATKLAFQLRYLQAVANAGGTYTEARMSVYTPRYDLYVGTQRIDSVSFAPGVNYVDGYLQMPTGTFLYDILGNGQMAGTVRLRSGSVEQDLHLFMGAGDLSLGSMQHDSA